MMAVAIKLTDEHGQTYGWMQWGEGVEHTVEHWTGELCSAGVIHCYEGQTEQDALALALLLNSIHPNFTSPRAFRCEVSGRSVNDGMQSGWETVRTVREIPVPSVEAEQYIEAAITVVLEVCDDEQWRRWAECWLSGTDRSAEAAHVVAAAAWTANVGGANVTVKARQVTWAMYQACEAAAWETTRDAAADAAVAMEWAVKANPDLDIGAIVAPILLPGYEEADDDQE
jgi:hypothetical protein